MSLHIRKSLPEQTIVSLASSADGGKKKEKPDILMKYFDSMLGQEVKTASM